MTVDEIIGDDHAVAGAKQFQGGVAADIAGAAGDQNVHRVGSLKGIQYSVGQ